MFFVFVGLKPDILPLNRNSVMSTVVNVIGEHIPEVKAINLSSNRLTNLHLLSSLVEKTPNVQGLDLSNNSDVSTNHPTLMVNIYVYGWALGNSFMFDWVFASNAQERADLVGLISW